MPFEKHTHAKNSKLNSKSYDYLNEAYLCIYVFLFLLLIRVILKCSGHDKQ